MSQTSLKVARWILFLFRKFRNFFKRKTILSGDTTIDPTAEICWSASIDPARGRIAIGKNTAIDKGVILHAHGGYIEIGENCSVNPYSALYGGGGLTIGSGVRIAAHTTIVASNHNFSDSKIPIFMQGVSIKGIVIENDVWIGVGARIVDGVLIGEGSVVGAGAVVTKSVEPYSVVVGVPAKKISTRIK